VGSGIKLFPIPFIPFIPVKRFTWIILETEIVNEKDEQKTLKKLAKAEAKTAKKVPEGVDRPLSGTGDTSPAERSAAAAEKQLSLHRWKVIFAAASALIALVSLIVLLANS